MCSATHYSRIPSLLSHPIKPQKQRTDLPSPSRSSFGAFSFLNNDLTRSSSKYAKGSKNYKINFESVHGNSTVRKRHESVLEVARGLERRGLELAESEGQGLEKRAQKGSVELTDYCEWSVASLAARHEAG